MRVLVTVQPLESHVRAIQQVVRTLIRMGHEVLLAAPEKVRESIESTYHMPYVQAGEDWTRTPGIGEELTRTLVQDGNHGFVRTLIIQHLTGPTSLAKARDIADIVQTWHPKAILADCTDIGTLVTAWQMGIPCISLDNGWTRPLDEFAYFLFDGMRRHWPRLHADDFLTSFTPPIITPCPRDLVYPDIPNMSDYRVEHPQRAKERLFAWVAELPPDRPLVYASLGSILTRAAGFDRVIVPVYQAIIDALRDVPCSAVLSVGRENVPRLSQGVPGHIRLVSHIDQPLFLQAGVDAILTPGGLGTVKELLTHAVTPIVLPRWSEGYHIARRVTETGLGIEVQFDAAPEQIATALMAALTTPSYRDASRLWQRRALTLDPLETVLAKLLP